LCFQDVLGRNLVNRRQLTPEPLPVKPHAEVSAGLGYLTHICSNLARFGQGDSLQAVDFVCAGVIAQMNTGFAA
jgi:hypothetical protein